MEIYKDKVIPATEERVEEVLDKTLCDICRNDLKSCGYGVDEVEIECMDGTSYPECGNVEQTTFDLCVSCFKKHLIPFFREKGAEPRVKKIDW